MIARPAHLRLSAVVLVIGIATWPVPAQPAKDQRQGSQNPEATARVLALQKMEAGPEAIAAYRKALGDESPAVRSVAVQLLCPSGASSRDEDLVPLLDDADENVAMAASLCLLDSRSARIVETPAKKLADLPDTAKAQVAATIGDRRDARYVDAVGAMLSSSNAGVRGTAVEALRAIGEQGALKYCMAATGDSQPDVVVSAVGCLEVLRDPAALPRLLQLAGSSLHAVRGAVGHATPAFAEAGRSSPTGTEAYDRTLSKLLADPSRNVVMSTLAGMERYPAPGWGKMVSGLLEHSEPRVRRVVVKVLRADGTESSRKALARALQDPEEFIRASAVQSLAESRTDGAMPLVSGRADDPSPSVRAAVAVGLGEFGDSASLPIVARLATDPDATVRASAMTGAAAIGGRKALEILEKGSADSEIVVRISCVRALGSSGAAGARAILRRLAGDEEGDLNVRVAAMTELGELRDRESIPLLRKARRNDAEAIRTAAQSALSAIGPEAQPQRSVK